MACHKEKMTRPQVMRILEVKRGGHHYHKKRLGVQGCYCEECRAYHLTSKKNFYDNGMIVKRKNAKTKKSGLTG